VRIAFINDWEIERFGLDYYSRGIEALSSATCVDLLNMMLIVEYNAFNKCKAKSTDDGNVSDRCIHYQKKDVKCHSSCTIKNLPIGEEIMIRAPKPDVNHYKHTASKKCYKRLIRK
jgi:hypothetical protein